jgi:hypothetical protein
MSNLSDLEKEILIKCANDYTGLWSIIRSIKERLSLTDLEEIRHKTMEVLRPLVEAGLIHPGWPKLTGRGFEPWIFLTYDRNDPKTKKVNRILTQSVDEAMDLIDKEWKALGREPNIGDVAWFFITDKGKRELELFAYPVWRIRKKK